MIYNHIFIEAFVTKGFNEPSGWVPLDPTYPNAEIGKVLAVGRRNMIVPFGGKRVPDLCKGLLLATAAGIALYMLTRSKGVAS